ncbi:hypothetical protein [Paenibacillus antarcticus]|uniref:Copper amine oxidase-like N-terminal domain-containing protein n=1 Tax=Paenibacillus antarcticus TaxID=253703 RepID=A0A168PB74_9BACL|nr:hypothetical protein [Paenibacillus antarcticus]OAB46591.1 hypothetical protein PBAT_11310 [Paenibacillus antarcticus]
MKKLVVITGLSVVILGASIGAYAASNLQEIKAYLSHTTKVKLDNGDIRVSLSQPIQTIIYKGSLYIPLKTAEQYTDVSATWNSKDQTVSFVTSPYRTFSKEETLSMNRYGYSLKVPKSLDLIEYTVQSDDIVQSSIQKGVRDNRVRSVINIRYYAQEEAIHVRHDDIASIEIFKLTDWNELKHTNYPGILLAQNKNWAFIVNTPSESVLPKGTLDHSDYTAYAQIIKNHRYYLYPSTK